MLHDHNRILAEHKWILAALMEAVLERIAFKGLSPRFHSTPISLAVPALCSAYCTSVNEATGRPWTVSSTSSIFMPAAAAGDLGATRTMRLPGSTARLKPTFSGSG